MTEVHPEMTREELGGLVCETLSRHGITVVLSGGAAVSIYSHNEYESDDLDLIHAGLAKRVDFAMEELGFQKETGRHWKHPNTRLWIEFPPGPVTVGNEIVTEFSERETSFGALRILPPTECVMDRLAHYFHFDDPQALDQAIAVAKRHSVDLARIEEWSRREASENKFTAFVTRLAERTP